MRHPSIPKLIELHKKAGPGKCIFCLRTTPERTGGTKKPWGAGGFYVLCGADTCDRRYKALLASARYHEMRDRNDPKYQERLRKGRERTREWKEKKKKEAAQMGRVEPKNENVRGGVNGARRLVLLQGASGKPRPDDGAGVRGGGGQEPDEKRGVSQVRRSERVALAQELIQIGYAGSIVYTWALHRWGRCWRTGR